MKIDPVKIENITKAIVKQKYIANQNLIDRINSLHISDTIENKIMFDFLYSVGKMYFIANKNTENYLRKALKFTNTDREKIEINMMLGVEHLRNDEYDRADKHFMECYPLQNDVDIVNLEWSCKNNTTSSFNKNDRIAFYHYIVTYFDHITPDEYFDFLIFQLRCNEVVLQIRKGNHQTAYQCLETLFNNMPNLNQEVISSLRNDYREKRKNDINIQVFDLATIYHYLGVVNWLVSDFDKALMYFHDSESIRVLNSHYLDLQGTYGNIGMLNNLIQNYWDGNEYLQKSLDLVLKFGEEKEAIGILFNIAKSNQLIFEFENSLKYSEEALKISNDEKDMKLIVQSLKYIGKNYQYMGLIDKSIIFLEKSLKYREYILDKRLLNYILFNLILLHNQNENYDRVKILLIEMRENIDANKLPINNEIELEIAKLDYNYSNKYEIDRIKIFNLINVISNNKIAPEQFRIAIFLLMRIDICSSNHNIFLELINHKNIINELKLQPLFSYYLIVKEKIYQTEYIEVDKLIEFLHNEKEITSSIKLQNEITKFLDEINQFPINKVISILCDIFNKNYIVRQFELIVN